MSKILVDKKEFDLTPFRNEAELEKVVVENYKTFFGENSYYFDLKKGIQHQKGDLLTIPDGYVIKFGSHPSMIIVENEMSSHDIVRHVALQFAKFHSALTDTSKYRVKKFLEGYLKENPKEEKKIEKLLHPTQFKSVSALLDAVIMEQEVEYAIVIDEKSEELERVVSLYHPDIFELKKYTHEKEVIYLLEDDSEQLDIQKTGNDSSKIPMRKLTDIDTIVCPAQEEGFNEVFLKEHRWFKVRISAKRIPQIKYIAMYESQPISAIRYIGRVKEIKLYKNSDKYEIILDGKPEKIKPIKLSKEYPNIAPQAPKYTMKSLIDNATKLEDIFLI